jgi:hypothetical protein
MEFSSLSEDEYAVVLVDRNTGIVLNPDTLERWNGRFGGRDHLKARSLDEAGQIAEKLMLAKADSEAAIYDYKGRCVRSFP